MARVHPPYFTHVPPSAPVHTPHAICLAIKPEPGQRATSPSPSRRHDVHTLERTWHIPAVAIVSSAFTAQALYQAEALGMAQAEKVRPALQPGQRAVCASTLR